MALTASLMAKGYRLAIDMLPPLNEWANSKGEPPLTLSTIREDRKRVLILGAEAASEGALDVEVSMAEVSKEAWRAYTDAELPTQSPVRQKYLELAERSAEAISRHRSMGIEAVLAERGLAIAEGVAGIVMEVLVEVIQQADIDSAAKVWIREEAANRIEAVVNDHRPSVLES